MYTRILTPLDGSDVSEQVLPYARAFASGLSLPMTLLTAIESWQPSIGGSLNPELHSNETEEHRARHAQQYLDFVATRMRGAGVSADTVVPRGEPSDAIVQYASQGSGTLVAMASHGRSGLARLWMGSVADRVLHMVEGPLLVVRSQASPTTAQERVPERLIVPVDGSEAAEGVLPHVAYLASTMSIPVDLVQITISEAEYYQAMSMGLRVLPPQLPSFESFSGRIEEDARSYIDSVRNRLKQLGVGEVDARIMQGSPADCIVEMATSTANSLVAMTTHGRSGVGRMILGNVAERVVRQSGGPVLLIRAPDWHQAPLTGSPVPA